jgi:threonine dehydrogenase-like Zn-dependent dehydrogenase
MKALVHNGPRDVTVTEVEEPRVDRPTGVLVRITRTNICGSDLHMYENRTDMEPGRVLGHENMGEVVEVGSGNLRVPWGDFNCLRLPEVAGEKQNDYVMLSDIFPTGCHATDMSGLQPGDLVVIYGAGPERHSRPHNANQGFPQSRP